MNFEETQFNPLHPCLEPLASGGTGGDWNLEIRQEMSSIAGTKGKSMLIEDTDAFLPPWLGVCHPFSLKTPPPLF